MVVLSIVTGLAAAVPITLAVENTAQRKEVEYLHARMDQNHIALDFIRDTISPTTFVNTATSNANTKISNGVLLAREVVDKLDDFTAHKDRTRSTSEKNTARSISAAMSYYRQNHSRPVSDDPDKD